LLRFSEEDPSLRVHVFFDAEDAPRSRIDQPGTILSKAKSARALNCAPNMGLTSLGLPNARAFDVPALAGAGLLFGWLTEGCEGASRATVSHGGGLLR
jgi:hypothetical protein